MYIGFEALIIYGNISQILRICVGFTDFPIGNLNLDWGIWLLRSIMKELI
jgi:hypothetical protein